LFELLFLAIKTVADKSADATADSRSDQGAGSAIARLMANDRA
jgi:hypothetical protein